MASTINASTSGGGGVIITPDSSGVLDLQSGNTTVASVSSTGIAVTGTISDSVGTLYPLTQATAVSASGTSVDFTGIPSWVKRITLMFSGVSLSGTSSFLIQLGDSGGIENTGYSSVSPYASSGNAVTIQTSTAGFIVFSGAATATTNGSIILTNLTSNTWISNGVLSNSTATVYMINTSGSKALSDVLTQVRITTVNGTDTFDAGTINILYE